MIFLRSATDKLPVFLLVINLPCLFLTWLDLLLKFIEKTPLDKFLIKFKLALILGLKPENYGKPRVLSLGFPNSVLLRASLSSR